MPRLITAFVLAATLSAAVLAAQPPQPPPPVAPTVPTPQTPGTPQPPRTQPPAEQTPAPTPTPPNQPAAPAQPAPDQNAAMAVKGDADHGAALALLDRMQALVDEALTGKPRSKAGSSGAVGTSGTTSLDGAGRVSIDRSTLVEIRAEIAQIKTMLQR